MSPAPSTATAATLAGAIRAADFIKLASEPTRASIVLALRQGDRSGRELIEDIGAASEAIAGHLRMLRVAGLIATDRGRRESRHQLTSKGRTLLAAIEALGANA